MLKLLLFSSVVTLVAAELHLFPAESGISDRLYDEDRLTAAIFGRRSRRQVENGTCGEFQMGMFEPEIAIFKHRGGPGGHGGPGGPGGPGGRGGHGGRPPPGHGRPPGPPPPAGNGSEPAMRCPPPPPPEDGSQNGGPGGQGGPPPHGGPHGGPPREGHGGPPPPHGHGGCRGPPPKCCNSSFVDDKITSLRKTCMNETMSKFAENGPPGHHKGRMMENVTECIFEKLGDWTQTSSSGTKSISKFDEMQKYMCNIMDTKYPKWGTKCSEMFNTCKGNFTENINDGVVCIRKEKLMGCPADYWNSNCTSCGQWRERLQKEKQQ